MASAELRYQSVFSILYPETHDDPGNFVVERTHAKSGHEYHHSNSSSDYLISVSSQLRNLTDTYLPAIASDAFCNLRRVPWAVVGSALSAVDVVISRIVRDVFKHT